MLNIRNLHHSLVSKLVLTVGIILFISISVWAYFSIEYHEKRITESIVAGTDKITNTIRLGTHYAMMLNSRDEINQIIRNIGRQQHIENIRIYNKAGEITFSNRDEEVGKHTNIKAEACDICHRSEPPLSKVGLTARTRFFYSPKGYRLLGIISPIYNEPGCSSDACHVHPEGKKVLGALDLVASLEQTDNGIRHFKKGILALTTFIFLVTFLIMFVFLFRVVNHPIKKLIQGTKVIAKGEYVSGLEINRSDEIGQLALAINQMGKEIFEKQAEINKKKDEYQNLFEHVPCIITVQDRNYRLIRYNYEFFDTFAPKPGDYCFSAYKGRKEKCVACPIEMTFEDGMSHYSEETGFNKDGTLSHWFVKTSPIRNDKGEIVAAMEMSIDITKRKMLEEELKKSEEKYYAFFNNTPNPVFVLDSETLEITDCNKSVRTVYGYDRDEIIRQSFLNLFMDEEKDDYALKLKSFALINRVRHINKNGNRLFVNIRVSPSEYQEKKVLLVTTSDITKRLEAEQQLAQASKMATLGEMATGVAHELNQPLAVMKTASSVIMKMLKTQDRNEDDPIITMSNKINKNVDRASKIINHMRQFARKSDIRLEETQVNTVLEKALDMFSQQLKIRGIKVTMDIEQNLPVIMAEPNRLEQVFVNLLINARDAIEESQNDDKEITIQAKSEGKRVIIELDDTGQGIPKNISDKIFEPFFTTKEVGKGTGIGLSISYGIVKDFGGDIKTVSKPGKGACFAITFPVQESYPMGTPKK